MATIQGIYLALFGRPADPGGLEFWTNETNNGQDLTGLIGRLTAEPEAVARFEGLTNTEVVTLIYQALFDREPDESGLTFFVNALNSGEQSLETIAINMLDGAQGDDATLVNNKIQAADNFTASLDTEEEIAAYVGDAAADIGRTFIDQVTIDPESIPSEEEAQTTVETLPPAQGQEPDPGQEPEPDPAPTPGGGGGDTTAPTFQSSATATVDENTTGVTTVQATDSSTPITYGIAGGADADLFEIDENTGELVFKSAPDFEAPEDSDPDNIYEVTVSATDDEDNTSTQSISIEVQNLFEGTTTQNTTDGDDVTPDIIFGSGNTNGGFSVVTLTDPNGPQIELGLRAKLRFDEDNDPQNTFNYQGTERTFDTSLGGLENLPLGKYTFDTGTPPIGFGFAANAPTTPIWNFEWSINTDVTGTTGDKLNDFTYILKLDSDPTDSVNFGDGGFDPINQSAQDHALGDNATGNAGGASDRATYDTNMPNSNVAQNSWNYEFFNDTGSHLGDFDPTVEGTYTILLEAYEDGQLISVVGIDIVVSDPIFT